MSYPTCELPHRSGPPLRNPTPRGWGSSGEGPGGGIQFGFLTCTLIDSRDPSRCQGYLMRPWYMFTSVTAMRAVMRAEVFQREAGLVELAARGAW